MASAEGAQLQPSSRAPVVARAAPRRGAFSARNRCRLGRGHAPPRRLPASRSVIRSSVNRRSPASPVAQLGAAQRWARRQCGRSSGAGWARRVTPSATPAHQTALRGQPASAARPPYAASQPWRQSLCQEVACNGEEDLGTRSASTPGYGSRRHLVASWPLSGSSPRSAKLASLVLITSRNRARHSPLFTSNISQVDGSASWKRRSSVGHSCHGSWLVGAVAHQLGPIDGDHVNQGRPACMGPAPLREQLCERARSGRGTALDRRVIGHLVSRVPRGTQRPRSTVARSPRRPIAIA